MMKAHMKGLRAASNAFWEHSASEDGDDAEAAIQAYLSESSQVLVPREATTKMLNAAAKAMSPGKRPCEEFVSNSVKHGIRYEAMISAAPNPFNEK